MYLLGTSMFKEITHLSPMINKTCFKFPPRIEKWIIESEDVDDLVYELAKVVSSNIVIFSKTDDTETTMKMIVDNDYKP